HKRPFHVRWAGNTQTFLKAFSKVACNLIGFLQQLAGRVLNAIPNSAPHIAKNATHPAWQGRKIRRYPAWQVLKPFRHLVYQRTGPGNGPVSCLAKPSGNTIGHIPHKAGHSAWQSSEKLDHPVYERPG